MKSVLSIILCCSLPTVCKAQRYSYSASSHNIPVFSKKFDSKIAANYAAGGGGSSVSGADSSEREQNTVNGFDIEAAFALAKHFAIQANYYYRDVNASGRSASEFTYSRIGSKPNILEFGIGYFQPVEKHEHLYFQCYAGAGFGQTSLREAGIDSSSHNYNRSYDAKILKFYLEPSITFRTRIAIAATIFTRASVVSFHQVRSTYSRTEAIRFKLDSLDRYPALFIEPGISGSFGFRRLPGIRIDVEGSFSVLHQDKFIKSNPVNFAIGLAVDFPKLIRWQKYEPYKW